MEHAGNDVCPFYNLENPAFSGFDPGGGEDSNAQAVLEVSVVNNLSLPVVYGVFPLAIKINYMSEHTQGNPGVFFPGGLKASHHTADVYKKTWTPGPGGAAIYELYRYVPLL